MPEGTTENKETAGLQNLRAIVAKRRKDDELWFERNGITSDSHEWADAEAYFEANPEHTKLQRSKRNSQDTDTDSESKKFPYSFIKVGNQIFLMKKGSLGEGTFGVVGLARGRDGKLYVVKIEDDEIKHPNEREINEKLKNSPPDSTMKRESTSLKRRTKKKQEGETPWVKHYSVMHYVGVPLSELDLTQLSVAEKLQLASDLIDELERLHKAGYVHLDLKPGNIVLGEDGKPRFIDFGAARSIDSNEISALEYTPGYLASDYESVFGKDLDWFALLRTLFMPAKDLDGKEVRDGSDTSLFIDKDLEENPFIAKLIDTQSGTAGKLMNLTQVSIYFEYLKDHPSLIDDKDQQKILCDMCDLRIGLDKFEQCKTHSAKIAQYAQHKQKMIQLSDRALSDLEARGHTSGDKVEALKAFRQALDKPFDLEKLGTEDLKTEFQHNVLMLERIVSHKRHGFRSLGGTAATYQHIKEDLMKLREELGMSNPVDIKQNIRSKTPPYLTMAQFLEKSKPSNLEKSPAL